MRGYFAVIVWMALTASGEAQRSTHRPIRTDRRRASNGVTEAWLLSYDNPDPDRSWERIAGTLVVARHGRVIRRVEAASVIRSWEFWNGGRQVALEAGGLHGPTGCLLVSIASGKTVATVCEPCDIYDSAAPGWVKVLAGRDAGRITAPASQSAEP